MRLRRARGRLFEPPTGLVVAIQDERSQQQNRVKAMRVLRARLFERERARADAERRGLRNAQVGSSARSERVRTYNFSANRVTDHRVGLSVHDMPAMMRGELLDDFCAALEEAQQSAALEALDEGALAKTATQG